MIFFIKFLQKMKNNIFQNISKNYKEEMFETIFEKKSLKIERIISNGQKTPDGEWYDQHWDEWVILLDGSAGLRFEGSNTIEMLAKGDYVYIPAGKKHRVEYTDTKQTTIWLAVHLK